MVKPECSSDGAHRDGLCRCVVPLRVTGARKRLGRLDALDGVDLTVGRGEVVGISGANGAGKSTLLLAIAGVLRLDAGEIAILGRRDPTRPEVRASIGFVSQEVALYERLSCERNLLFFGELAGLSGPLLRQRVGEALALADLSARRSEPVHHLSGGMKRRLHFAAALLHRPSLVLLDEPTAGMDPEHRQRLVADVRELGRVGVAVVMTTHHADEAVAACDRVAMMRSGSVVTVEAFGPRPGTRPAAPSSIWGQA